MCASTLVALEGRPGTEMLHTHLFGYEVGKCVVDQIEFFLQRRKSEALDETDFPSDRGFILWCLCQSQPGPKGGLILLTGFCINIHSFGGSYVTSSHSSNRSDCGLLCERD